MGCTTRYVPSGTSRTKALKDWIQEIEYKKEQEKGCTKAVEKKLITKRNKIYALFDKEDKIKKQINEVRSEINSIRSETGWDIEASEYSRKRTEETKPRLNKHSKCWVPNDVDRELQEIAVLTKFKKMKKAKEKFDALLERYGIEY